jgi:hypothetical protein
MFFSGNTCYWRLIFPMPEKDGQPDLRFITRDNLWADTGRPEDSLTGVGFRNGGERNYPNPENESQKIGYSVQNTIYWPFEGTGLGDGMVLSKIQCIVGYECDGTPFDKNAPRPVTPAFNAGDHTPDGFVILATGDTTPMTLPLGNSAATMGMFTQTGTAFTGGTTDWARVVREGDPQTTQITRNVLNRLGGNPKGLTTLSTLKNVIACDGFFSSDDSYRHAVAADADGGITEIFFNPKTGSGQTVLVNRSGLLDIACFFSDDDHYRHVITANADGSITEIFYNPQTGLGQAPLGRIPNALRVAGFFSGDDNFRHAIVATNGGSLFEIFFNPRQGQAQSLLGTFSNIVDIGAFYSLDDHFRHVIVGTADGTVTEVYFHPSFGVRQAELAKVPGLVRVSGYYAADDPFFNRRVQVLSDSGRIHEIRFHQNFGIMRVLLFNSGPLVDLGGFFSNDDKFRHAILATPAGDVQELFFSP